MKKLILLTCAIFFALGLSVKAEDIPMDPAVRYGKLENGITYYIRHNEEPKERASFYIAQNVGAILENDDQNGLAHFLEHMAFNGTKHFEGKGIIKFLEKHGVKFGANINAYTAHDETVYNLSNVPTNKEGLIDSCLLVLNDWSNYLLLTDEEIDAERGVITEEWRTRRDSRFRVMEKQNVALLAGSKYAERDVIGDLDVIQNFEYKTLRDFYHDWYRTDLQAIIMVGDFDVDEVEAKVKNIFSKIPAVENPIERKYYSIPDHAEPNYALASDKEATHFAVGILNKHDRVPNDEKNKAYLENLYKKSLFNAMVQARITERLQKPNPPFMFAQIAVGAGTIGDKELAVLFTVHKEGGWEEAVRGSATLVEKIRKYGFTQGELDRAKANLLASFENAYKMREKTNHDSYAKTYKNHYMNNDPMPGIEYKFELVKDLMPRVELAEFKTMAQELMAEENMTLVVNGPEKEGAHYPTKEEILKVVNEVKETQQEAYADEFVDKPLIAKEPVAGKIVERKDVEINELKATELKLSNGIRVLYYQSDIEKENVFFNAQSWGGTSLLSEEQLTNATFLGNFMGVYGLGDFSKTELQKKLTGKIASCNYFLGTLSEGLSGKSSPKDMETMFRLMYLRFTQPRFDKEAYDNMYPRLTQMLANIDKDVKRAFSDSISVTLADHHPRVKPLTKESIKGVTFEGIKEIYLDRFANPGDFVFTFSGNFETDKLEALIEKYIASLPTVEDKETYKDNDIRTPEKDVNNHFQRALETPKNTIYVNLINDFKYNQENRIYGYVLSQLLSKRYLEEIREKEGGTYGVGVRASSMKRPVPEYRLSLQFDCDPEKAEKLKGIALSEIDQLIKGKIIEKELDEIKNNILKVRKENQDRLSYWHGKLNTYATEGEKGMSNDEYEAFIKSIDTKTVAKKAKKLLKNAVKVEVVMSPK